MLSEAEAEIPGDTTSDVEAKGLFDTLADTLRETEPDTLGHTL